MLKILVLGCGSIGERHIRCLTNVGGVAITPVDPRPVRLQAMQERYGTEAGLSEYEQADLAAFDAVWVCTPSDQHVPQTMRAARAGCHVLVEKPISTTLDGVDELIATCHEAGVVLQVGYVLRHHLLMAEIERVLATGDIGPVQVVGIKVGYPVDEARPDFRGTYWMRKVTGGGVFYDATHQLDYIQHLVAPITAVTALTRHYQFEVEAEVEDAGMGLLEFGNGAVGTISLNHFQRNRTSRTELVGSTGTVIWEIEKNQIVIYRDADRSWSRHRLELDADAPYLRQAASFLEAVRGEHPPVVTGEEGRRALQVALAALQSAESGRRVVVGEASA